MRGSPRPASIGVGVPLACGIGAAAALASLTAPLIAAAPATAPVVPTAPASPTFQYVSAAGYPVGTSVSTSYGTSSLGNSQSGSFDFNPAQETSVPAGGYLPIRNTTQFRNGASGFNPPPPPLPSGAFYYVPPVTYPAVVAVGPFSPNGVYVAKMTTEYGYVGGVMGSGGGTTIQSVESLVSSGPTAVSLLGNAVVGDFTAGNGGYPIQISQEITVKAGPASSLGGFSAASGYFAPASYVTGNDGGLFSVGDGGYGWVKVTGTLNTMSRPASLGTPGWILGNDYGTYVGNGGGPPFKSPIPPTPGSSGYGPNQVDAQGFLTDPAEIFPTNHPHLGGPANGTGYGIVNVDGGTWNNSNGALQIGFGSQGFVTVDSGGSINLNNTPMVVGQDFPQVGNGGYQYLYSGVGTVVVNDGNLTSTGTGGYVVIGLSLGKYGSTGRLYLTGSASKASISSGILVGDGGYGLLAIENGASATSAAAYAAGPAKTYGTAGQPGSGNVVIDGAGSSWTVSGNADFGVSGVATVTVQNHGDLNIGGTLTLGDQFAGNGTLAVQADGTVESGDATLGNQAGAKGFANVSNINTLWTVDGDLTVGNAGQGTLTLSNNGEVITTGDGILGSQAGSTGSATVTDAGTEWQINGELKVGDNGNGTMQVENGGFVSLAGNLAIADSGGTSSLTLDGNGSRIIAGGTSVTVGGKGDGTLTVQNAADAIFSGASVSLGENSTGTGTLTVQGSNTMMSAGSLTVGSQGTGTVNVQDSATLSTGTNISLGDQSTGSGTLTIDGASVTDAGTLSVGGYGTGTLTIQNSGSLTVQGNDITLGEQNTGSGTLNLVGSGSTLTFNGDMTIGKSGSGTLSLSSNASFSGTSMTLASGTGFGGASTGGTGELDISGASSVLLSQDLTIGKYGVGTLAMGGSSVLANKGDATLGSQPGTEGSATLNFGSSWTVGGSLTIGSQGTGTVTVQSASSLIANGDSLTIGKGGGVGTLTATDQKTQVQYAGDLIIGKASDGTFNIQNGAVAQATANGTGDVYLAETSGINGNLNIDGSASSLSATNLVVGGTSSKSGGAGNVDLTAGGQLSVSKVLTMWKNGSLNLAGNNYSGGVTVGTGTAATAGNLAIYSSGELAASGAITGSVTNVDGTVSVGNGTPGTLKITGNFNQTGGVTKVSVYGTNSGQFSQLDATGKVSFSGGTVEFDFGNGFAPLKGQTFQFVDPPQSVDVSGSNYTFTGLAPGFDFTVNPDSNGLLFTALSNGVATTTATPEPAALGLLAVAGIGLLLRQRRRGNATIR